MATSLLNLRTSDPASQKSPTLLSLPAEITDLIYSFCLPRDQIHISLKNTIDGSDRLDPLNWNTAISLSPLRYTKRPHGAHFAQREYERLGAPLLSVCSQINTQATRILYAQNTFNYSVQVSQIRDLEFAIAMLGRLGLEARNRWMRRLYISKLELKRLRTLDLGPEGANMLNLCGRYARSVKAFCDVIRGMKGLRELGVGIYVPGLRDWRGRVEDVSPFRQLIELAGPGGTRATIVVWWVERPRRVNEPRDGEEMFVRKVVEAMEERRTMTTGGLVGKGLGVEYLERSVDESVI